jgi:hypothetical protein
MKVLKSQSGSMLIPEIILGVLVLAAVGFAIYSAIHSKNKAQASKNTPMVSASPSPSVSASPAMSASPKPSNEFEVSQLGIKMTLPTGLTGLVYSIQSNQTGQYNGQSYTVSIARFSTTALEQDDPANCSDSSGPVGTISDFGSFNPTGTRSEYQAKIEKLGNSYYEFGAPEGECSTSSAANKIQSAMWPLLSQAFSSASPL